MAKLNPWSRWEIHYAGGQLATVAKHDDPASPPSIAECEANARLIAASPDLLAVANVVLNCMDCYFGEDLDIALRGVRAELEAAIAKAEAANGGTR